MKSFDDIWEIIHTEMEWGKYPPEEVIRFVARNFYKKDRANIKILDAGCGTGAVSWYLAREGFSVYAFDGSVTAIDKARKRLTSENLEAKFKVLDATETNFEDEMFDSVIDNAMIYANTVGNIKRILREYYRVLKPGGKTFSSGLFKIGMTGYGTGEKLEDNTFREVTEGVLAHRGTVHFFSMQEIEELWSQAGFRNIVIDSMERTDFGGKFKTSYFIVCADKI